MQVLHDVNRLPCDTFVQGRRDRPGTCFRPAGRDPLSVGLFVREPSCGDHEVPLHEGPLMYHRQGGLESPLGVMLGQPERQHPLQQGAQVQGVQKVPLGAQQEGGSATLRDGIRELQFGQRRSQQGDRRRGRTRLLPAHDGRSSDGDRQVPSRRAVPLYTR